MSDTPRTDAAIIHATYPEAEVVAAVVARNLERENAALREAASVTEAANELLDDIVRRTAIALKGPEEPGKGHSWHDLPERAAALREALERARGCIKGLLARTPMRDVAETLAEIEAALGPDCGWDNTDCTQEPKR